jgi:hypothetical protein
MAVRRRSREFNDRSLGDKKEKSEIQVSKFEGNSKS